MANCVIARPINNISLNGLEFVLDEFGEVKRFQNKDEAVEFLKEQGLNQEDIDSLEFLENYWREVRKLENKQKQAFFRARQAGVAREIALNNGSTGEFRQPLTKKQSMKNKRKRNIAKASRKANRKK